MPTVEELLYHRKRTEPVRRDEGRTVHSRKVARIRPTRTGNAADARPARPGRTRPPWSSRPPWWRRLWAWLTTSEDPTRTVPTTTTDATNMYDRFVR